MALPEIDDPLRKVGLGRIQVLREQIGNHGPIFHLLDKALVQDPPHSIREGGIIKPGFDPELDKLRDLSKNGKSYIAGLEQKERQLTGLNSLKVGYNSVFGYFLEAPKSAKVPEHYIRKQTTAGAERYITAELKEHESLVLGSEEKAAALESEIFSRLRQQVAEHCKAILQTARAIGELDVLATFAEVAARKGYVKPEILSEGEDLVEIKSHLVEIALPRNYPRVPPQCRMLTPVFHPNIAPHAICVGDHWWNACGAISNGCG